MPATYTVIDHTADLGIIVQGDTPEAVFACAAQAMFAIMGAPLHPGQEVAVRVEVEADSQEDLLVTLLSELLGSFEVEGHYLHKTPRVTLTPLEGGRWRATLGGDAQQIDRSVPQELIEVKAVTYHALAIRNPKPGLWAARVIFDL